MEIIIHDTNALNYFLKALSGAVLAILIFLITLQSATAQNEYLSSFDYTTMSVTPVVNIPGVTYVKNDNTTCDPNTRQFFFQGNATGQPPFNLYTINLLSNSIAYSPVCPSNMGGEVVGLQIDIYNDTLWGLWLRGPSLCWINPGTGAIHLRGTQIPNYAGYSWSAYTPSSGFYLVSNGKGMLAIDKKDGRIVYNLSLPNISNLYYDQVNDNLYGIDLSGPTPQFVSVSYTTGAVNPILNLPPMTLPQLYTCTIDEYYGKYIFVGTDPPDGGCISNYLYVIDLNSGTLESRKPYPYAQGVNSPDKENLLAFCFNTQRNVFPGTLYALNWYPPTTTTGVSIVADPELPCDGVPVTFTAKPGAGVINPFIQWQINGNDVGTNSTVYANYDLLAGDTIRCILTDPTTCIAVPDTSNFFVIGKALRDTVIISVSSETICTNGQITLMAKTINAVASPIYQWFVNGNPVGTNNNKYVMEGPMNGDSVVCIVTTNATCILPDSSNLIIIKYASLDASVIIHTTADAICSGETLLFTATAVDAGPTPTFKWQINGISTGTGKDTLMAANLQDGDQVSCILTGGITCSHPVLSNTVTTVVKMTPFVYADFDTVISPGKSVKFNPSVSAPVSSLLWAPQDNLDNSSILTPTASPAVSTTYQLTVTADDGCQGSAKFKVIIYHPLKMPNAFTPNGDGLNDLFRIPPVTTQNIKSFSVFNRWGERLFITMESGGGWDGTFNGQMQPPGTYIWEIQYQDLLSKKVELVTGTVELVR
jgi:gliding motility-associated-like protein